ncbi:FtsX-like permease family protein [Lacinutrix sp. C3R15]|uniref:ABC transporter permease n=1 Tax=Flavobacteriaceae TaxID=49546 RepID=UPI001C080177|nr:FtsX-like permease family protein [Oceanihabitans sp. 1_MG-2023]MBU2937989.1 FtsX-like permease family protein [Lacinutrix sp. C3R15]MDO6621303.1 FtsX-like permease family protein [Oceanihabitans sp. 1_MG-2023]
MNFALYIAKRYLHSKSSNNAINFITIIAAIGIVLGAASLFVVLSGFAGLKDFTLQFTSIVDPDLKAETAQGKSFLVTNEELKKLDNLDDIISYSKIIEDRVFLAFDNKNYPNAYIKGVDENYKKVNIIDSVIPLGSWLTQDTNQIVVGWGISSNLSFGVLDYGKRVSLYVPKPGKGQITATNQIYNTFQAVNVGIFDINEELNDKYVYAPFAFAKDLLGYQENQISAIEFKLKDNFNEEEVRTSIQNILGNKVILKNRAQLNDALYKMLNTEYLAVYLIFTLVLIIALFNVIGSIIMMILDKKKNLNTLFNLGATQKDIRKIFFYQGILMTVIGGIVGLIIGLVLILLQQTFSLVMITPSLPYPVSLKAINVIIVFLTITVLGVFASKIASTRITKNLVSN